MGSPDFLFRNILNNTANIIQGFEMSKTLAIFFRIILNKGNKMRLGVKYRHLELKTKNCVKGIFCQKQIGF